MLILLYLMSVDCIKIAKLYLPYNDHLLDIILIVLSSFRSHNYNFTNLYLVIIVIFLLSVFYFFIYEHKIYLLNR